MGQHVRRCRLKKIVVEGSRFASHRCRDCRTSPKDFTIRHTATTPPCTRFVSPYTDGKQVPTATALRCGAAADA